MPLLDVELHLFLRLVKLAGFPLRLHFADDLLEHLHRFMAGAALVALDVQLNLASFADGDVKFALGHVQFSQCLTFRRMDRSSFCSSSTTLKPRFRISSINF